jgi:hypothetical protein
MRSSRRNEGWIPSHDLLHRDFSFHDAWVLIKKLL